MIAYEALGPQPSGEFIIGYRTPGAPHVITVAGTARTKQSAESECVRLNEESERLAAALAADYTCRTRVVEP